MSKIHIIIGTTSINRPDLHNKTIPGWVNILNNLNDQYEITWFVNIDYVKKLNYTLEETKINYEKLIKKFNPVFLCNEQGNFLHACKRLATNINEFVEKNSLNENNVKIFWLEDDWTVNSPINFNEIISLYSTNNNYINLTFLRNNYIWALAPSIISFKLWKNLFYNSWDQQKENIDPESCVGIYFKKIYGYHDNLFNLNIINRVVENKYLNNKIFTYPKSHYTININLEIEKREKYIDKNKFKEFVGDEMNFVRITPTICSDVGREYIENLNLTKAKNNNGDFYDSK
jgi:hypothetical protein